MPCVASNRKMNKLILIRRELRINYDFSVWLTQLLDGCGVGCAVFDCTGCAQN